jgi:hypothetical protein
MNTTTNVEAMAPYELIHDARRLLAGGDVLPAAVMARAALDTWLRARVADLRRPVEYASLRAYLDVLRHYGTITPDQAVTLRQVCRIGSRAAHNHATLSWDVEWMIGVVVELVEE